MESKCPQALTKGLGFFQQPQQKQGLGKSSVPEGRVAGGGDSSRKTLWRREWESTG